NLRQSAKLHIYATAPVLQALSEAFPVRRMLEPYAHFQWAEIRARESFPLFKGRLEVYPFALGYKPPRYAATGSSPNNRDQTNAWVIGYRIVDHLTQGVLVYAPGIEAWSL